MGEIKSFRKTRIAPTPSGYLHLGNVLSFALTAELARQAGASILLRIDDLDRDRVNPDYVQDIFDTLINQFKYQPEFPLLLVKKSSVSLWG